MNNEETVNLVLGWIKWNLDSDINEISKSSLYKDLTNALTKKTIDFLNSDGFRDIAYEVVEDILKENEKSGESIECILPTGFENNLKVFIYNKSPDIALSIKRYINDVKFQNIIKTQVNKFASGSNPMVAKFVKGKNIETKVINSLNSYIDNTDNVMKIIMFINDKVDEINKLSLKEVLDYMPYEGKRLMLRDYVDSILDLCNNDEFVEKVTCQIQDSILDYGTIGNLFESLGLKEEQILDAVEQNIAKYLKNTR